MINTDITKVTQKELLLHLSEVEKGFSFTEGKSHLTLMFSSSYPHSPQVSNMGTICEWAKVNNKSVFVIYFDIKGTLEVTLSNLF